MNPKTQHHNIMAKHSLIQELEKPEPEPSTALAETTTRELAASMAPGGAFEGDFNARDVSIPYLSIVGKTSSAMDEHPQWLGQFLYDKWLALGDKVNAVFFRVRKYYKQSLDFGSQEIPERFDRLDEAKASGVDFHEVADIDCLIEVPAESGIGDEVGGKYYAPARLTVQKSSYGATVPILRREFSLRLKNVLHSGLFSVEAKKRTGDKGSWYVPNLRNSGFASQELQDYIAEKFL